LAQREEIALGRARGDSIRAIAAIIGRSPSTVSRELRRNANGLGRYRATSAHALAYHRASRPKPAKLLTNLRLRSMVEADLAKKYSPEQIAGRLKVEFPDQPEMQVSTETLYQSLYVQSRGALKRDLTRYLRAGRAVRRPSRKVGQRKNRIQNMINIAERPAEADDRAVPGHWELGVCVHSPAPNPADVLIHPRTAAQLDCRVGQHQPLTDMGGVEPLGVPSPQPQPPRPDGRTRCADADRRAEALARLGDADPVRSARLGELLGAVSVVPMLAVPPMVGPDRFSYPFDAGWHIAAEVFFPLQHLTLLAGVVGLAAYCGRYGSRLVRAGLVVTGLGVLTLVG
jgi:hypothetical protein